MEDRVLKRPHFVRSSRGDFFEVQASNKMIGGLRIKLNGDLISFEDERSMAVPVTMRRTELFISNTAERRSDTGFTPSGTSFPSFITAELLRRKPEKIKIKLILDGPIIQTLSFLLEKSILDRISNTAYYGSDKIEVTYTREPQKVIQVTESSYKDLST